MRYLDPGIGTWTSRDPGGMIDGVNLYQYVGNNPLLYIDPTGLKKIWILRIRSRVDTVFRTDKELQILKRAYSVAVSAWGAENVEFRLDDNGSGIEEAVRDPETIGLYVNAHGSNGTISMLKYGKKVRPPGYTAPARCVEEDFGDGATRTSCDSAVTAGNSVTFPVKRSGKPIEFVALTACNAGNAYSQWKSTLGAINLLAKPEILYPQQAAYMATEFLTWLQSAAEMPR